DGGRGILFSLSSRRRSNPLLSSPPPPPRPTTTATAATAPPHEQRRSRPPAAAAVGDRGCVGVGPRVPRSRRHNFSLSSITTHCGPPHTGRPQLQRQPVPQPPRRWSRVRCCAAAPELVVV